MIDNLKVGDPVEVLDPGLAMLRALMPDMPPNHHGIIVEVLGDGEFLIEFPIGNDDPEEHSQIAPYSSFMLRKR